MLHLCGRHQRRRNSWRAVEAFGARVSEYTLVLVREDFDEARLRVGPVLQNPCCAGAASQITMAFKQAAYAVNISTVNKWLKIDAGLVAATRGKVALVVVDIRDPAAHAGGEV